jgi:hypothetical protein
MMLYQQHILHNWFVLFAPGICRVYNLSNWSFLLLADTDLSHKLHRRLFELLHLKIDQWRNRYTWFVVLLLGIYPVCSLSNLSYLLLIDTDL